MACRNRLGAAALLAVALCLAARAASLTPTVEIAEVKVAGVAASDESKSVIQVQWRVNPPPGVSVKSFEVAIEITYANGGTERLKTSVNGAARTARFEVVTARPVAGQAPAALKSFRASVTATVTETATKQGAF